MEKGRHNSQPQRFPRERYSDDTKHGRSAGNGAGRASCPPSGGKRPGSRTKKGRELSRLNAVKHGIFACVVLEGRESKKEFRRLIRRLRKALGLTGVLAEFLVPKLAMLIWRLHRTMEAEKAEILRVTNYVHPENEWKQREELRRLNGRWAPSAGGLLEHGRNPLVLRQCIEVLRDWRSSFAEDGFSPKYDRRVLERIYGHVHVGSAREDFPRAYIVALYLVGLGHKWAEEVNVAETNEEVENSEQRGKEELRVRKEGKQSFLKKIDEEIARLAQLLKAVEQEQTERLNYEMQVHLVPVAERLARYETMLNREIDRTLTQVERLRRWQQGDKDLPPIKLDVLS